MFNNILGQDLAKRVLQNAITHNRLAQAYLFYGPAGTGKYSTALAFAMAINCQGTNRPCGVCNSCKKFLQLEHPDFCYIMPTPNLEITPQGEIKSEALLKEYSAFLEQRAKTPWKAFKFSGPCEIRLDMIRFLQYRVSLSKNEARTRVFIIEDADKLNVKAANAFLKTLEEPPPDTVFILTTTKPDSLLPTIISRCQKVAFTSLPANLISSQLTSKFNLPQADAAALARISSGNMEKALQLAEQGALQQRQQALKLLQMCLTGDDASFYLFAQDYKGAANQGEFIELISYLLVLVSDAVFAAQVPERLVNIDEQELLTQLAANCPDLSETAGKLVVFLQDMQYKLVSHVNPQLIIFAIYHKLLNEFGPA